MFGAGAGGCYPTARPNRYSDALAVVTVACCVSSPLSFSAVPPVRFIRSTLGPPIISWSVFNQAAPRPSIQHELAAAMHPCAAATVSGVFGRIAKSCFCATLNALSTCSLGAMGDLTPTSSSFYWFPQSEQQVPLKQWYEARVLSLTRSGNAAIADEEQETTEKDSEHEVFNGGIMGHGIGFSRILAGLPGLCDNAPQPPRTHTCYFAE